MGRLRKQLLKAFFDRDGRALVACIDEIDNNLADGIADLDDDVYNEAVLLQLLEDLEE